MTSLFSIVLRCVLPFSICIYMSIYIYIYIYIYRGNGGFRLVGASENGTVGLFFYWARVTQDPGSCLLEQLHEHIIFIAYWYDIYIKYASHLHHIVTIYSQYVHYRCIVYTIHHTHITCASCLPHLSIIHVPPISFRRDDKHNICHIYIYILYIQHTCIHLSNSWLIIYMYDVSMTYQIIHISNTSYFRHALWILCTHHALIIHTDIKFNLGIYHISLIVHTI